MSTNIHVSKDMKELLAAVQAEYDHAVSVADYYMEEYRSFRKDDEIRKIEEQLREVRRRSLHVMSEVEYKADSVFREKHYKLCGNGNTFQYELSGTGIGTVISVRCPICGEREDITDFGNW